MRFIAKFSIGRLMGLIALLAVEMTLFQRVLWFIAMIPPVTIGFVLLNLATLYALRWLPRSAASQIYGMLCGGLIALFVLVGYYLLESPAKSGSWHTGIAGAAASGSLANLAGSRSDPSDSGSRVLRLAARSAFFVEIVMLDLLGLAVIWAGGWISSRQHAGLTAPASSGKDRPSPLDDRAATPL